ncbi:MAG: TadE/TadG family type IV pilus assembly protein, partial [Myxococcota bacterium]
FAVSLPVILLLVIGTVDFTMWTSASHRLARSLHDGARVGTATLTDDPASDPQPILDATEAAVLDSAELAGFDRDNVTVTAEWRVDDEDVSWVRVTGRVPYEPLMPYGTPFQQDVVKEFSFIPKEQPHL